MKAHLVQLLHQSLSLLRDQGLLPLEAQASAQIEYSRDPHHGDYACNIALSLSKVAKIKPTELAKLIINYLPASPLVAQASVAGPGFINFTMTAAAFEQTVPKILKAGTHYGYSFAGAGQSVHIEYVSGKSYRTTSRGARS